MEPQAEQLSALADRVRALGIVSPVLVLLELLRPLAFAGYSGLLTLEPLLNIFLGSGKLSDLKLLLSDRQNIEALIKLLEEGEAIRAGN